MLEVSWSPETFARFVRGLVVDAGKGQERSCNSVSCLVIVKEVSQRYMSLITAYLSRSLIRLRRVSWRVARSRGAEELESSCVDRFLFPGVAIVVVSWESPFVAEMAAVSPASSALMVAESRLR